MICSTADLWRASGAPLPPSGTPAERVMWMLISHDVFDVTTALASAAACRSLGFDKHGRVLERHYTILLARGIVQHWRCCCRLMPHAVAMGVLQLLIQCSVQNVASSDPDDSSCGYI